MKRFLGLLLLMALLLCACGTVEEVYTVNRDGIEFLVNTREKTISHGGNTYSYEFSGDAQAYRASITYPDGSSYGWSKSQMGGQGGWSPDYDENAYVDGDTLCAVLLAKAPRRINGGKVTAGILLLLIGALNTAFPAAAWQLEYGWRFKGAEPSEAALVFARISGIAAVIIGIILLLGA